MKLNERVNNVESGFGDVKENTFSIAASAKAFKILSDSLYTNKILAIVRELSCNALDAHIMKGNADQPFDLQLPSTFDSTFRIRDYGIGLSEDDVMHLYTTYFESTKTGSDDFVGALGLGSKSPFSYTDSFTVTSWFDGFKREFAAYINEDGFPHIMKIGESESDEPTGMEVRLAAKKPDIPAFRANAEKALRFFTVKPNITGQVVSIPQLSINFETDSYLYCHETFDHPMALQGPVAYPIDVSAFTKKLSQSQINLLNNSAILKFEIGELNIAPSREALSLDTRTQDNIIAKLEKIQDEMRAKLRELFSECKTTWQAQAAFHKVPSIFRSVNLDMVYKGERIIGKVYLEPKQLVKMGFQPEIRESGSVRFIKHDSGFSLSAKETDKCLVVIKDIDVSFIKINDRMSYGMVLLVPTRQPLEKTTDYFKRCTSESFRREIVKFTGGAPVKFLSELNFQYNDAKNGSIIPITPKQVYVLVPGERRGFRKVDYDYSNGGIYLMLEGGEIRYSDCSWGSKLYELNSLPGVSKIEVVGVPKMNMELVQSNPKWINFNDFYKDAVIAAVEAGVKEAGFQDYQTRKIINEVTRGRLGEWMDFLKSHKGSIQDKDFVEFIEKRTEANLAIHTNKYDKLVETAHRIRYDLKPYTPDKTALEKKFEALNKKYPILEMFQVYDRNRGYYSNNTQQRIHDDAVSIVNYINLIHKTGV